MKKSRYLLPVLLFLIIFLILAIVQLKVDNPMIILERFFPGGGWIEIPLIALYGAFVVYKMQDPVKQPVWRLRIWTIFSVVFFGQLILGISGIDRFLMTGKLHLPLPAMILAGPLYRADISFMTILFLSTVIISGPAWCSQLCYFGALDGLASSRKGKTRGARLKLMPYKMTGLLAVIVAALLLRLFNVSPFVSTLTALAFAAGAILVMIFISSKKGRMIHCLAYCPIGTIVNYTRFINPFRFRIDNNCTTCMKCIPVCRYDALSPETIRAKAPGITCTLCGDCISACKPGSFYYKFPGLGATASRNLYLGITITLHAVFMALARI